jgi:hypothetical protein
MRTLDGDLKTEENTLLQLARNPQQKNTFKSVEHYFICWSRQTEIK